VNLFLSATRLEPPLDSTVWIKLGAITLLEQSKDYWNQGWWSI